MSCFSSQFIKETVTFGLKSLDMTDYQSYHTFRFASRAEQYVGVHLASFECHIRNILSWLVHSGLKKVNGPKKVNADRNINLGNWTSGAIVHYVKLILETRLKKKKLQMLRLHYHVEIKRFVCWETQGVRPWHQSSSLITSPVKRTTRRKMIYICIINIL